MQRAFSLGLGIVLILLGAASAAFSALQFRRVVRTLGAAEIPRGYWIAPSVWLNFLLAGVGLALAIHFVISDA
jgi:putative membrane protein